MLAPVAELESSDPARTATLAQHAPAPAVGLSLGMQLGHFRIERKLGAGGMGEVYLAIDLALDRTVAIKVLPAGAATGDARDRMIREARAQARVQHPNVAHIYFVGEEAGRLYFAMEHVAGETLAAQVARGPIALDVALATIRAAALGLREAQRAGFAHRDIKPSNLMLDAHGVVKILDFGLVAARPDLGAGTIEQTTLAGTPLYMAPEQARGDAIDHRADIYALGCTLFHLIAGRPPFEAATVAELVALHQAAQRPALPRDRRPRATIAAIDRLLARMFAADPRERFATYDDLVRALDQLSADHARPVGFWVRAVATGIDLVIAMSIVSIVQLFDPQLGAAYGSVLLPIAAAITTLAIAVRGTTPGKALFDLELFSPATGQRPTWRQALVRQLSLATPLAVLALAAQRLGHPAQIARWSNGTPFTVWGVDQFGILSIASIIVAIALLVHATRRVPGSRAPWDRLSGTQVRYRPRRSG
jgi:hypothetical protein